MIRINKPATAPPKLATEGKNKAAKHHTEYIANASDYQNGTKTFNFSSSIYNHPSVKEALVLAQHKKCCFCERLIGNDKKGKTTIENLGLDRSILNDVRLEHLQKMKIIYQLIQIAVEDLDNQELQQLAQQAKESLEHAVSDQGEFAAATRASLNDGFELFL